MMKNQSGLKPLGVAVLIKAYEPERKGGQIVLPDAVASKMSMVDQRATVIAIGPVAWKDEGYWKPLFFGLFRRWKQVDRAKVGDKVLVTKYAGFMAGESISADSQQYRLVNDRDIFCAIEGEQA
jgi:co-chaperonin GroES (HSP10)